MSRIIFAKGLLFDGTGSDPATADVAVEDGRIADVGPGLDGDERIDLNGKGVLPGMFDCHTHVVVSDIDVVTNLHKPFSYRFFEAARNLEATLRIGITSVRDAGGADLGVKQAVANGLVPGPRLQISLGMLSQSGGHGDGWTASGETVEELLPRHPGARTRCAKRSASWSGWAPT